MIPQYNIIHFQTEPQKGTQTLFFSSYMQSC